MPRFSAGGAKHILVIYIALSVPRTKKKLFRTKGTKLAWAVANLGYGRNRS